MCNERKQKASIAIQKLKAFFKPMQWKQVPSIISKVLGVKAAKDGPGKSRIPTMQSSLETLVRYGVDVKAVIDIGILNGTPPLMEVFPHVKQYLFEPVEFHLEEIRKQYHDLNYELFNIALSDKDGDAFLIGRSVDHGDTITHSSISDTPVGKDQDTRVLVCNKLRQAKLDSVLDEVEIENPFLLKIDVDGHELPILRGAEKSLKKASIVVIEAPLQKRALPQLLERYQHMLGQGFVLFDIVDFAYYDGILWQVDLIFVRQDIVNDNEMLRPFETKSFIFNRELWHPLTREHYS